MGKLVRHVKSRLPLNFCTSIFNLGLTKASLDVNNKIFQNLFNLGILTVLMCS